MTKRERVINAIRFKGNDFAPYDVSFTKQMREKMVAYTGDKNYVEHLGNHIAAAFLIKPEVEVKPEYFRDEFGVVWNKSGADKDIGVIDHVILKEYDDLKRFEIAPVDEAFIREKIEHIAGNGDLFRMAAIGFSMFERAWTLRGMENLLCDMMDEPDFVHELLCRILKRNMRIIDIALQYDIDGFYFGDDWGQQKGLIMGPTHWRTFIKPYVAEMYAKVRDAGKFVIQHSCGDIRTIIDDLSGMGLNVYQTFQPEIYGLEYANVLKNRITIWGGISTQMDLPVRTPEEIRAITRDLLNAFSAGGLIAAPTHAVPGDVPPENIVAMMDVIREKA